VQQDTGYDWVSVHGFSLNLAVEWGGSLGCRPGVTRHHAPVMTATDLVPIDCAPVSWHRRRRGSALLVLPPTWPHRHGHVV